MQLFAEEITGGVLQTGWTAGAAGVPARWPGVGSVLGRYELLSLLGRGSGSRVYRARHTKLRICVAVKVFDVRQFPNFEQVRRSLTSEAVLLARLNHPNIVRLWDLDDEGPFPYLVTEFIDGVTLGELFRQHGRLPADFAVALVRQAVAGLEAAYAHGIVHRDIKPNNILMANDMQVKLVDLGLAMLVGQQLSFHKQTDPEGLHLAGTAAYLAPEQARNPNKVDHRADMYSLGATLYQAVTGRMPFEGKSVMQVIHKHLTAKPVPPSEVVPDVPGPVSDLILRLLAKEPGERFETYEELREALAEAVGDRRRQPRSLEDFFYKVRPLEGVREG